MQKTQINEEKKQVLCKGRLATGARCDHPIYLSDGRFIYIFDFLLNPEMDAQSVICPECGYQMNWKRNKEFFSNPRETKDKLFKIRETIYKSKFT